jgi:hypothetical protein
MTPYFLPAINVTSTVLPTKTIGDEFQQQFLPSREEIRLLHEPHIWRNFERRQPYLNTRCEHTVAVAVAGERSYGS